MKNPQFEKKIHQNILRPLVDRTSSPTHGVILFFDQVTNTATVMLSGQGSDEAAETISKVPCPVYSGVQSVAPEPGRPCFPKETLILTKKGIIPIEQVEVGDLVYTHRNRWREVEWAGKTGTSELIEVRGHGGVISCTSDHQFYSREIYNAWFDGNKNPQKKMGSTEWTEASKLIGSYWATPRGFPETLPILPEGYHEDKLPDNFWWVVGRWVGDGWTAKVGPNGKRGGGSSKVGICCGHHETDFLGIQLAKTGWNWHFNSGVTADRFCVYDKSLRFWLRSEFGSMAYNKTIPVWLLGASTKVKTEFLNGYISADGSIFPTKTEILRTSCGTVSPRLAIGIKLLASSLDLSPRFSAQLIKDSFIDGRRIKSDREVYSVSWGAAKVGDKYCQTHADDDHLWGKVKSLTLLEGINDVYDLQVKEDHSFIANGIVVHNCLVVFKDNNRAYPYISHYFNNDYGNIDYLRSYKATTSTPHYMFTF